MSLCGNAIARHEIGTPFDLAQAAAVLRRLPSDSAETVLLHAGQCHSSIGGNLPSRCTPWNRARSCLHTCLGATNQLLNSSFDRAALPKRNNGARSARTRTPYRKHRDNPCPHRRPCSLPSSSAPQPPYGRPEHYVTHNARIQRPHPHTARRSISRQTTRPHSANGTHSHNRARDRAPRSPQATTPRTHPISQRPAISPFVPAQPQPQATEQNVRHALRLVSLQSPCHGGKKTAPSARPCA